MNRTGLMCFWGLLICMSSPCYSPPDGLHTATTGVMTKIKREKYSVSISTKVNNVQIEQPFDVTMRVVNTSEGSQSIRVLLGYWIEHWNITNARIVWAGGFQGNSISDQVDSIRLKPGEVYKKTAHMMIVEDPGCSPVSPISFQVGFTPIGEKKTYWSSRVVLGIKPGKHK